MLKVKGLEVVFNEGTINEKYALQGVDLVLNKGDFASIIGSNGAGKSTLLNAITGSVEVNQGSIVLNGKDITYLPEYKRANVIGRLFQDPLKGTAPHMTIEENLGLAFHRGKRMSLGLGVRKHDRAYFKEVLKVLNLGLEDRLENEVGTLSGGQRQALTLLMATLETPDLLLLDEHTAALDPKTAQQIMHITKEIVEQFNITTLMVTHNIDHALHYGNKTIVMSNGKILKVLEGEERDHMGVQDIMKLYSDANDTLSDRTLLG